MPRSLIGGDLKFPKCRRWSSSRIGGAGSMPLGFITLLSEKGGRYDENETQKSTFFSSFFLVTVGIVLFRFGGFMMNVVHAPLTVCYDCTIVCVLYYY
jgi:hypothetical protein